MDTKQPNKYILLGPDYGKISVFTDNTVTDLVTDHNNDLLCDNGCLIHSDGRTLKPISREAVETDITINYEYVQTNCTYNYTIQTIKKNNEQAALDSFLLSSSTDPFSKFAATLQDQPDPSLIQLHSDMKPNYYEQINSFILTPIGIMSVVAVGIILFFLVKS
ncbi:Hypothetical protein NTJ_03916 [Nesidiocoris tenuis]|uniref:DOMON domain-containing protein n=1 Tax=Nesidiocoris tenuis TaxID=355587 RepID=A0ABN7AFR4_9HEMI|nr:Hypothetical protein NTJ_03916 [Nesidiocoris tenuis]